MKRITSVFIIASIILFAMPILLFSKSDVTSQDIEKWRKALIWANYEGINRVTGFFVSKSGIAVIPYHLVGKDFDFLDGFKIYVMTYEKNKVYDAEILSHHESADLIFIKINYKPRFWFDEFESPKEDMRCMVLGFPLRWKLGKEGRVIVSMDEQLVGVDIPVYPGASGSCVVSLEPESYGKVLMMATRWYGYLVGTPSILIKSWLDTIKKKMDSK